MSPAQNFSESNAASLEGRGAPVRVRYQAAADDVEALYGFARCPEHVDWEASLLPLETALESAIARFCVSLGYDRDNIAVTVEIRYSTTVEYLDVVIADDDRHPDAEEMRAYINGEGGDPGGLFIDVMARESDWMTVADHACQLSRPAPEPLDA